MINQFLCTGNGDALEVTNAVSGTTNPAQWFYDSITGGGRTSAGVVVNGYTALTHCPLWQGINIIAGDIGQTPVSLVRNTFDVQPNHPASKLLRLRPNGLQTPSAFLETLAQWALMWGQGCAWIQRQGARPTRLVPLRPDCLWKELIDFEGEEILLYHYYSPLRKGGQYIFFPWEVIDIPGLTSDGVCGYELHRIARETIAQGLALERHGNATFRNGARPGGVVEAPAGSPLGLPKNKEWRETFRREFNEIHQGTENSGKLAILWEGLTYKALAHTNQDAQWLEAKKMSREEAASLLNLPPHKLGSLEDSSVRSNLEEQNADYAQRTLTRWYNRMSEEFRRKLLTEKEWMSGEYEFVWDVEAFLKADVDTMTTVLDRLVKATILNPNEARAKLRLPPREGGEVYGSPAINPNSKGPEDGAESPDNGRPEGKSSDLPIAESQNTAPKEDSITQQFRIVSLIRDVVSLERAALQSAARTKKDFVGWLDAFYGRTKKRGRLLAHLRESVNAAPLKPEDRMHIITRFRGYALQRKRFLLDLCGKVTAAQLPEAVENFTNVKNQSTWGAYVLGDKWRFDDAHS